MIDEFMQSVIHDLFDVQKFQLGTQSAKQLLGAVAVVALGPSGNLEQGLFGKRDAETHGPRKVAVEQEEGCNQVGR